MDTLSLSTQADQDELLTQAVANLSDYLLREESDSLRELQRSAMGESLALLRDHIRSFVIALNTGSGKTYLAATMARETNLPGIFLVTSQDLAIQAQKEFEACGVSTGIYYENDKSYDPDQHQMLIIHYDTAADAIEQGIITPEQFALYFSDEAHMALSDNRKALYRQFEHAIRVALTATPDRDTLNRVEKVFGKTAIRSTLDDAIELGEAAPYNAQSHLFKVDQETQQRVEENRKKYRPNSAEARASDMMPWNQAVAELIEKNGHLGKQIIVAAESIPQARAMEALLNEKLAGKTPGREKPAAILEGSMSSSERQDVVDNMRDGQIRILVGKTLIRDGLDIPSASVLYYSPMGAPWELEQKFGRVARIDPNDPDKVAELHEVVVEPYHENRTRYKVEDITSGNVVLPKGRKRGSDHEEEEDEKAEELETDLVHMDKVGWERQESTITHSAETPPYILERRALKDLGYRSVTDVSKLTEALAAAGRKQANFRASIVIDQARDIIAASATAPAPEADDVAPLFHKPFHEHDHLVELRTRGDRTETWLSPPLARAVEEQLLELRPPKGFVSVTKYCNNVAATLRQFHNLSLHTIKARVVEDFIQQHIALLDKKYQEVTGTQKEHIYTNDIGTYISRELQILIEPLVMRYVLDRTMPTDFQTVNSIQRELKRENAGTRTDTIIAIAQEVLDELEQNGHVEKKLGTNSWNRPHILELPHGPICLSQKLADIVKARIKDIRTDSHYATDRTQYNGFGPDGTINSFHLARGLTREKTIRAYADYLCDRVHGRFSREEDIHIVDESVYFSERLANAIKAQIKYDRPEGYLMVSEICSHIFKETGISVHGKKTRRLIHDIFDDTVIFEFDRLGNVAKTRPPEVRTESVGSQPRTRYGPRTIEALTKWYCAYMAPDAYVLAEDYLEYLHEHGIAITIDELETFCHALEATAPEQAFGHDHMLKRLRKGAGADSKQRHLYLSPELISMIDDICAYMDFSNSNGSVAPKPYGVDADMSDLRVICHTLYEERQCVDSPESLFEIIVKAVCEEEAISLRLTDNPRSGIRVFGNQALADHLLDAACGSNPTALSTP